MPQLLQLRIPTPCQEHWTNMQPAEKGRHCAACQKTVVDFTTMSDPEIVRYLAQAGPHICGRLAPNQVNRTLALLPPPQRNGWSGWRWLLAGLLMTSNEQEHHHPARQATHEHRASSKTDDSQEVVMGKLAMPLMADTARADSTMLSHILSKDTSGEIMGDISVTAIGSIPEPGDSIQGPMLIPKVDPADEPESLAFTGEVLITPKNPVDSVKQFVIDTLAAQPILSKVDSATRFLADTLTALHLLPKKALTIAPNPARRGSAIRLSWQTEPGSYIQYRWCEDTRAGAGSKQPGTGGYLGATGWDDGRHLYHSGQSTRTGRQVYGKIGGRVKACRTAD